MRNCTCGPNADEETGIGLCEFCLVDFYQDITIPKLESDLAAANAIIEKLPLTADKVRVVPGDPVYHELRGRRYIVKDMTRAEQDRNFREKESHIDNAKSRVSEFEFARIDLFYSTRKAAEDAQHG